MRGSIHFSEPHLLALDSLRVEAVAACFFEDERPLQGLLGLVDWRLAGLVSRALINQKISGKTQEKLLVGTNLKFPFDRVFAFGLGPMTQFNDAGFTQALSHIFAELKKARVRTLALALPGRMQGKFSPEHAISLLLEMTHLLDECDDLILLEPLQAQAVMELSLQVAQRKARSLT